jgi:hypothetical protein
LEYAFELVFINGFAVIGGLRIASDDPSTGTSRRYCVELLVSVLGVASCPEHNLDTVTIGLCYKKSEIWE